MSTVKSKKLQVGTDATSSNNFTIYQPATPDGTLRIGVGNADSPTEVGRFNSNGYVATNAPVFGAYPNANQSITTNTTTKVAANTEDFDTNSCYDTTNYRFTPTVAGYYQVTAQIYYSGSGITQTQARVYKNGTMVRNGTPVATVSSNDIIAMISTLVYMNGSTDYLELYARGTFSGATVISGNPTDTYFQAHLARAV